MATPGPNSENCATIKELEELEASHGYVPPVIELLKPRCLERVAHRMNVEYRMDDSRAGFVAYEQNRALMELWKKAICEVEKKESVRADHGSRGRKDEKTGGDVVQDKN